MIDIRIVLTILLVHWFADFVKQTDQMARNKSTSNEWLGKHVMIYTFWLLLCWPLIFTVSLKSLVPWILLNGALHFLVDYCTSRITSKMWKENRIHEFFVVVGLDQFIHSFCLLITYYLMVK